MAKITKGTNFPHELESELFSLIKGKSSMARLSGSEPLPFVGKDIFTFNFSNKLSIVGEGENKPAGDGVIAPVSMVPVKTEYQERITDEFMYASEEEQIEILRAFSDGFAKKLAEGLDIMAMHGLNPADNTASAIIGANSIDGKVTNVVNYVAASADVNINDAITLLDSAGYMANGIAMSPAMRGAIGAMTTNNGWKYPDFNFGAVPANLGVMQLDVNPTVAAIATGGKADHAIIGDFNCFRWGIAKEIPLKVIEYGDPDGQGDLQRKNEIVLRAEAYIGWAIMDKNAFSRVREQ